ncbi:MAG: hypothetical protein DMG58_05350 [Acidobacteria bacterium]|nr:MAG: hypothetical protein DMG58_05350 [Acidobacteriota bacterium]
MIFFTVRLAIARNAARTEAARTQRTSDSRKIFLRVATRKLALRTTFASSHYSTAACARRAVSRKLRGFARTGRMGRKGAEPASRK